MKNIQATADKAAIGLSFICVLHCLATPFMVVALPAVFAGFLSGETFHLWLLFAVVPISLLALTMGCNKHRRFNVVLLGCVGIAVMLSAVWLGHDKLGESGEQILTLLGACIIAVGHWFNHRLCRESDCECHSSA